MKTKSLGVAIAAGFALCAMFLGNMFPIIGSSVFALILGIALNEFFGFTREFTTRLELVR